MNKNTIYIKYHNPNLPKIQLADNGDWIDLRAAETVELKPLEFHIISLGISMKLPEGYEAHIAPRSSTFKNYGVLQANGIGVVDNSYSGNDDVWGFPALAVRNTTINEGDRICQFRIVKKMTEVAFEEVDRLSDQSRGGFGSTGVR